MINVSIARRYARALLTVATESNRADDVLVELRGLVAALEQSPELRNLLESPGFSREQRQEFLSALAASGQIQEPTVSFLRLLVDRGRTEHLEMIARIYREIADEAAGRIRAEVHTPRPLEAEDEARLAKILESVTKKKIELRSHVDETLIGGLIAKVGDRVFDGSIKTQLKRIRQTASS